MPEEPCTASPSELTGQYVDLQVNGYAGVDFNDPHITVAAISHAASAMRRDGVAKALPTIITAAPDAMASCLSKLRTAIQEDPVAHRIFAGIHIEGPFLSPEAGYIGAHPAEHASTQDLHLLSGLLAAAEPFVKLVTLAPEVDRDGQMTALCHERGMVVAAGHTNASLKELETCIDQGLQLFTHLGNGCPRLMDRHDNIIYRALNLRERLSYSLIADSFHIPQTLFENLLNWLSFEQIMIVSDAISAAGLGPGTYQLAGKQVEVGRDRAVRDPSGENFMGAACSLRDADQWLASCLHLNVDERKKILVDNPLRLLHHAA